MTSIEWTDRVWNPTVGCTRVSPGCEHCYAERIAHRGMTETHRGLTVAGKSGPRWTGEVRTLAERLTDPLRWRKPSRIFVNSMSDLFHEGVPDEFIDRVWATMLLSPQHTFQVLTKRADRMRAYLNDPTLYRRVLRWADVTRSERTKLAGIGISDPGMGHARWIWLGVSVESPDYQHRIDDLRATPAAVRFLSLEPLLAPLPALDLSGIHWIIAGGESGPGARPCRVEWINGIVRQCRDAGVSVFVKQLGARPMVMPPLCRGWVPMNLRDRKGGDMAEWPEDLRVREFPPARAEPAVS